MNISAVPKITQKQRWLQVSPLCSWETDQPLLTDSIHVCETSWKALNERFSDQICLLQNQHILKGHADAETRLKVG